MPYQDLAYIVDGATAGSLLVRVVVQESEGSDALLYDAAKNLLGTALIEGGVARIETSRELIKDEAIIAYVNDFGEKSGGPVIVLDNQLRPTGWLSPVMVLVEGDTMTTTEYTEETGNALADIYDPSATNRAPQVTEANLEKLTQIGFDLNVNQGSGTVVVSVSNVRNVESYLIRFDDGALSGVSSKTYSSDTIALVRVEDAMDSTRFHERSISVIVATAPTSAIWAVGYGVYGGGTPILRANAYCEEPLQVRCVGILDTWIDCITNGNYEWHSDIGNGAGTVIPGTFTLEFRVKASPSDVASVPCIVTL